jgi:hypothetical protein
LALVRASTDAAPDPGEEGLWKIATAFGIRTALLLHVFVSVERQRFSQILRLLAYESRHE